MPAYVGRDLVVEYWIADETASVGSASWSRLGMMRGKDISIKWDDVDTTGDTSAAYMRTSLVTFKNFEFSGDFVAYSDALQNQGAFKAQVFSPSSATGNQPKMWFRLSSPHEVFTGPCLVTECSLSASFDAEATWKMAAKSIGAITYTAI